jgi:predicted metal-dependent phosphoesterase TrpH
MKEASINFSETMKLDLHCHSEASHDCETRLQSIINRCHTTGINVQAITDHNQIWGAVKLEEMTRDDPTLTIIVGEEISTKEGEIIGLFLQEKSKHKTVSSSFHTALTHLRYTAFKPMPLNVFPKV